MYSVLVNPQNSPMKLVVLLVIPVTHRKTFRHWVGQELSSQSWKVRGQDLNLSSLSLELKFLNHSFQEKIYNYNKDVCLGARILKKEVVKIYVDSQNNWGYRSQEKLIWKDLIFKISIYSRVGIA